mgnify:CR=1 FL=1|tara:strand:+ start:6120 stop:6362 length:243 start_codon:yes stop_codon:yes gene_type:complete
MGSILSKPKAPPMDPELIKQREAEELRLKEEGEAEERRKMNSDRVRKANLIGSRSTQSEDIEGFTGFRRKQLGTTQNDIS